jgi:hypothetical protein
MGDILCAVPWPACPNCLGEPLSTSGRTDRCRRCGGTWPTVGNAVCGRVATHKITDTAGGTSCVCASHAEITRRQIIDAVVEPISASQHPGSS